MKKIMMLLAGVLTAGMLFAQEPVIEYDKTEHDYTVIINVDSISEPVIRIHTGRDGKLTNEIVGLMNVIISRK